MLHKNIIERKQEKGNVVTMGMAASQVRFLSLQNRKNTIGLNLMTLANRKTALSRDMNRVAAEYNNAMNQKVLKWSGDSGVTYHNLDYNTLMKPNDLNSTLPYIITDNLGRVVVDDQNIVLEGHDTGVSYRDLAMMVSAYSGSGNNGAEYNNTKNLQGGSNLTPESIADASVADKAESGIANEKGYDIVVLANQLASNTLRYDLMLKLGLINETEKNEILQLEKELYGSTENATGPYPIDSLMGQYYLACANLAAFNDLSNSRGFNFALSGNTTDIFTYQNYALDGTEDIEYLNTTGGTNQITFNGASSYIQQLDLKGVSQTNTDGNFGYTIQDGKINYSYTAMNLLNLAGTVTNSELEEQKFVLNSGDRNYDSMTYLVKDSDDNYKVDGANWENLYSSDAVLILASRTPYNHDKGIKPALTEVQTNLKAYINVFGNDLKTGLDSAGLQVNATALENAKTSTYHLFYGDVLGWGTENSNANDDKLGWRTVPLSGDDNYEDTDNLHNEAMTYARNQNLFCWGTSEDGHNSFVATVSAKNLINSFVSFYDYYCQTGNSVITRDDDIKDKVVAKESPTLSIEDDNLKNVSYETVTINNTVYDIQTYQVGNSDKYLRKYYASGLLVQEESYSTKENYFDRVVYAGDGKTITNYYENTEGKTVDTAFLDSVKGVIGKDNSGLLSEYFINTSGNSIIPSITTPKGGVNSDNSVTFTFNTPLDGTDTDTDADTKELTFAQSRGSSTYSTYISAGFSDKYREILQKAVDDAAAAKDAALNQLDLMFAGKESKIMDYFDAIFKMIAENGWVYDKNVNGYANGGENSRDYLNAKLQNNMYFITEVDTLDGQDFNYATKLATNVSKIFQVYDTDAQNVALSKYESEKADITAKEKLVDLRMNKLETEQDAISTELDSIKQIIKDNVDVTFKIFT